MILPLLSNISGFKNVLLTATVSVAIGAGIGFYTSNQFHKADLVKALSKSQTQTASAIVQANKESQKIDSNTQFTNNRIDSIRFEIAKGVSKQNDDHKICSLNWYLDIDTVRLLDSARTKTFDSAAPVSDGKGSAASNITTAQFLDNDLQVVKLYHELATRHDALVDFVNELMNQQAGNK